MYKGLGRGFASHGATCRPQKCDEWEEKLRHLFLALFQRLGRPPKAQDFLHEQRIEPKVVVKSQMYKMMRLGVF